MRYFVANLVPWSAWRKPKLTLEQKLKRAERKLADALQAKAGDSTKSEKKRAAEELAEVVRAHNAKYNEMLQQRLANGRLGKLWSDEDRIPAWWRSAARGADPNDI